MEKGSTRHIFSTSSLHDICLSKLIEEFDHYSPEMLSLLPPVQRKELLLYCPVVSICHLEETCAFSGIDSDTFWDDLLKQQFSFRGYRRHYDVNAYDTLRVSHSSNREKYFTFLTAMIFSGDRFSGIYGRFINGRDFYEGGSPPPEQRCGPDDIVNYLVAHRKPAVVNVTIEKVEGSDGEYSSDDEDFYYPLPARDVFGKQHGELYEVATKGQHVHCRYSHYILKENHYRLSDEDAVSLMMNECHFYPKKLFLHEYEHMHWKWSHDDLRNLLTQFFGELETLSLHFRQAKDIDNYLYTAYDSKEALAMVLSCCFSSPVLRSLDILDPVLDDTASKALSSTLAIKPCPSLEILDIFCWVRYSGEVRCLEALAKIIASHSQLTEICVRIDTSAKVNVSSFSRLYNSLIGFVQGQEFSKLTLKGLVPLSSQLLPLLDAFFKTPCSQPQEFNLQFIQPVHNEAITTQELVGDSKLPSGALEYKSLFLDQHSSITMDFCEWLFLHAPLVLKAFSYDANIVSIGEYGRFILSDTAFPIHLLSGNTLFQTRELSLPIFDDFPNPALQDLLCRQQLTHLSLQPSKLPVHIQYQHVPNKGLEGPKPCNINAITEILSCQKEHLIELKISRDYFEYASFEPSVNMERFGDALFSLRNFEIFSLCITIVWKKEDTSHIDTLYKRWLKHGCRKIKSFQMGRFEYRSSLTDEIATKLDKMGLVITAVHDYEPPREPRAQFINIPGSGRTPSPLSTDSEGSLPSTDSEWSSKPSLTDPGKGPSLTDSEGSSE